jgi:hypothetical protein
MATYNSTKAFLQVERQRYKELLNGQKLLRFTALQTQTAVQTRVQQRGLNSSGALIGGGKYSSGKLSFGPITNAFFDNANQRQFAKRFSKKNKSPGTFEGGYIQLRRELGRQVAFIDLTLSGQMFRAFITAPNGNGWAIGFTSGQSVIAGYNEKRFGRIFGPTDKESKYFDSLINQAVTKILS